MSQQGIKVVNSNKKEEECLGWISVSCESKVD